MVMLREFKCENIFSYGDEATLSMVASESNANDDFLYEKNDKRLLKVASIYGANASGKSNIIKAMKCMLYNIVDSPYDIEGMPFYLRKNVGNDSEIEKPMMCEFEILIENKIYKYGYRATEDYVAEEWLREKNYTDTKFKDIFYRKDENVEYYGKDRAITGLIPTMEKSKRGLFLHFAGKTAVAPFSDIFSWCKLAIRSFETFNEDEYSYDLLYEKLEDPVFKQEFLEFIKNFDPTIEDIKLPDEDEEIKVTHKTIYVIRNVVNNGRIGFSIDIESDGTKRIFRIYLSLKAALKDGALYLVDELDSRLHPWIIRELIRIFHDESENPKGAQLIFSAHSTACMNGQDLRMDEIFFAEKNVYGSSSISRLNQLASKRISHDADFGKYYLLGQFGAIPKTFIGGTKDGDESRE